MGVINNIRVHDLAESIYASGYAMKTSIPSGYEWEKEVKEINIAIHNNDLKNKHIKRAISLANANGGGHNQWTSGVLVSFDLTFTNKAWIEAERYKFLIFVTSASTMHRISKMDIKKCCSDRVDNRIIEVLEQKIDKYNNTGSIEDYRDVLDNIPSGFEITARVTTNYRCLKNIYQQRHNHRLKEWQNFCEEIKQFPLSKELIIGE